MNRPDLPPEVATYLAAVREALADLPAEERDDLLAEVTGSLLDTAGESERPITARLGPPEEFAAELRAAAGLEPAGSEPKRDGFRAIREAVARAAADRRIVSVRRVVAELAPIWWLARAYLAVAALALLTGASWSITHPAVPRIGTGHITVVVICVAAAASVALGLLARRRRVSLPLRSIAVALNLALLAAAPAVLTRIDRIAPVQVVYEPVAAAAYGGLTFNDYPIHNIYPYTRDGRLLHDVFLYDEIGRPLDVAPGIPDPDRRFLVTSHGDRVYNSFPIRYYDPGTERVAHPNLAPGVKTPQLLTPPLKLAVGR
ncbi:MAG: hypothetical protein QOE36_3421 [Gaiellaceae bacterium]|jgi:uncharacterized membrane protein|nr:hypothetical protein [Gaiellaceae bacterium]